MAERYFKKRNCNPEEFKHDFTLYAPNFGLKRNMMLTLKVVLSKSWIKRFKGFSYVGVCNFVMVMINKQSCNVAPAI